MKRLPNSISKNVVVAVYFAVATAAVTGALFYFQDPIITTTSSTLRKICLPAVRSMSADDFKSARDQITMPDLPQVKAAWSREITHLSRGERSYEDLIQGYASWYGGSDGLDGASTASGELFDAGGYTAAHYSLPFGTLVKVTYLKTGKSIVVRINDRGPFVSGRIIDLSRAAAEEIGLLSDGVGIVQLKVLP